jgi:hypothetical protein
VRRAAIAAAAAIVVVGLGAASVPLAEAWIGDRIKAEIERNGAATVERVEVGLFDRRITLVNVRSQEVGAFTARRVEASGLSGSFGDFLQGRTPLSDFRLGEPLRADHLQVVDARLSDRSDDGAWSVASLVADGVDLARYDPQAAGPRRIPVLVARIAGALSMRDVEIGNLIQTLPVTGTTAGFADLKIDRFTQGKIDAVEAAHLEVTARTGSEAAFKVDRIEAKDVDLHRTLSRLSAASWTLGMPAGRIEVSAMKAEGFGGTSLATYGISLDAVTVETTHDSVDSRRSRLRIDGLVLRPAATLWGERLRRLLQALDLKDLQVGFDCASTQRRSKGELAIDRCLLEVADLGELSLVADFVDVDERFWRAIDTGDFRLASRSSIALGSARLSGTDKGGLDRAMRAFAAAGGRSPGQARAKLAQDIRSYQPPDVLITDGLTRLLDTVAQFVEKGGTLAFDLKPDPPLGFAAALQLRRPGPDLVDILGLSATLSR